MKSVALLLLLIPLISKAHHSFGTNFDLSKTVEIEGEVVEISWTNPHIRLVIIFAGEHWEIEGQSSGQLARIGVDNSQISIGDVVKVAGPPSRSTATLRKRCQVTAYITSALRGSIRISDTPVYSSS